VTFMPNAWFTPSIACSKIKGQFFMMTPPPGGFLGMKKITASVGLLATDFVEGERRPSCGFLSSWKRKGGFET